MIATIRKIDIELRDIQPGGVPAILVRWALNTDTDPEMERMGLFAMTTPPATTTLAQLRTLVRNELTSRGII